MCVGKLTKIALSVNSDANVKLPSVFKRAVYWERFTSRIAFQAYSSRSFFEVQELEC